VGCPVLIVLSLQAPQPWHFLGAYHPIQPVAVEVRNECRAEAVEIAHCGEACPGAGTGVCRLAGLLHLLLFSFAESTESRSGKRQKWGQFSHCNIARH